MARGKKSGLGRGFEALFVENGNEVSESSQLPISEIEPDREQPRKNFDDEALAQLSQSISEHGILQPIVVRPTAQGRYVIVAGERRWRAARLAGLTTVPVVVRELTKQEADELALVENLQREDLNPVEEAAGYRRLMENYGMTQEEVAARVGKSRPNVANAVRLLALPQPVLEQVERGELSAGHARALLPIEDQDLLIETAAKVLDQRLSVRQTESLVKSITAKPKAPKVPAAKPVFFTEAQLALTEALGRRVTVTPKGAGGSLTVEFLNREELETLVNKLSKE